MNFRVDILSSAEFDIYDAALWLDNKLPGDGERFVEEAYRAAATLSETALLHRIRYKKARWVLTKLFSHRIIYYVENHTVKIFAVVHTAESDRVWKQRL